MIIPKTPINPTPPLTSHVSHLTSKKIAVLCNYELLPERVGGMDQFFWRFYARCKENGVEVDWFFPNKGDHGKYGNLNIIPANGKSIESSFLEHLQKNKPTYTHVITHFLELCTPFYKQVKQITRAKVIAVDHNPRPLSGYPFQKKLKKRLKGFLYSRYTDIFVGVSKYTVGVLINDFGPQLKGKTLTIYNGVLLDNIVVRDERSRENPVFLVASHLRESKGIQDLIEAVALLPEDMKKDITIDIYGDGPFKRPLMDSVEKHSLRKVFNFKGSLPNLNGVYGKYDYMLQPTHMECFSLSVLESLAANVPVVTTQVGGNEEVVSSGKNGYIYKARDINSLSGIIMGLAKGKLGLTENTRPLIENSFSVEQMVDHHYNLLK